jgi:hypothetical protein
VLVRKAIIIIGIAISWLVLFLVTAANYNKAYWLIYLIIEGFEYSEWSGFLSSEIGMSMSASRHYIGPAIIATIPLVGIILIRSGRYRGWMPYLGYLNLLLLGLVVGIGLRILLLRERLQAYGQLTSKRYLENPYEYYDLKFEEWGAGGLALILSLLCLKMLYEKRKLISANRNT